MKKALRLCTFMIAGVFALCMGTPYVKQSKASETEKVNDKVITNIVATDAFGRVLKPFAGMPGN